MFFHEFLYESKRILRQKEELFWVLLFPIILGSLFHFAFGSLNDTTENFHTIPIAVCAENSEDSIFRNVLETLSEGDDTPLLRLTDAKWEDAVSLLEKNEVRGIFKIGADVSLTCASSDNSGVNSTLAIEQSILESILREYKTNKRAVQEIAESHPENLQSVLNQINETASYGKELELTPGNMDSIIQYYFNLIAMACLFTSFAGSQIAIKNQANLSALGARKCASPVYKFISVTAQFFSSVLTQFICIALNVLYLYYVLKIEFGTSLPYILFTSLIGCMVGISFGFFIGSIGRISENAKTGLMVSLSLLSCFLSGLMLGNMRSLIESFCPLINDINPAVLISDSFLTLNIYGATARYGTNLCGLLIITVLFLSAGCLMIRRKTYASL